MVIQEVEIVDDKLVLPKGLLRTLKWKYPFCVIPNLNEYSQKIIDLSKEKKRLPYF